MLLISETDNSVYMSDWQLNVKAVQCLNGDNELFSM